MTSRGGYVSKITYGQNRRDLDPWGCALATPPRSANAYNYILDITCMRKKKCRWARQKIKCICGCLIWSYFVLSEKFDFFLAKICMHQKKKKKKINLQSKIFAKPVT